MSVIGQSEVVHQFSDKIYANIEALLPLIMQYKHDQALPEYQSLVKEAQKRLGITQGKALPVRKLSSVYSIMRIAAIASPTGIYVNESLSNLSNIPYGQKRCSLYHEVIHEKYHDASMALLVNIIALVVIFRATDYALEPLSKSSLNQCLKIIISLGGVGYLSKKLIQFVESRADLEGHYATDCAICVKEHAQQRNCMFLTGDHPLQDRGYLSGSELNKIADDLGDKRCDYHMAAH